MSQKFKTKIPENDPLSIEWISKRDISEGDFLYGIWFVDFLVFDDLGLIDEVIDAFGAEDGRFDRGVVRSQLQKIEGTEEDYEEDA